MNYPNFSFSQLGKQILQEKNDVLDQYTLELLNNFNQPQFFNQALHQEKQVINQINQRQLAFSNYIQQPTQQTFRLENSNQKLSHSSIQQEKILENNQFQLPFSPIPPPPIFFPSTYSFFQKEEQERQNQEKLRMLLLMKKLKEENFTLRQQLGDRGQKSFEESSRSVSKLSQSNNSNKSRLVQKKKPLYTKEDVKKEIQILEQMKSKRAQIQLKTRIRRLIQMLSFLKKVKAVIEEKKEQFLQNFPQNFVKFQQECFQWMSSITSLVTQKLKQQKNLVLYLEEKINPKEVQKRMDLLKTYVKNYIDSLYDNYETIPIFCKEFLQYFTHNFYCTPPEFLLKFEINRLLFTNKGGTILDIRKGQMMILTIIVARMYTQYLSEIWEPIPASSSNNEKKLNQQFLLNLQTISSATYLLMIQFLRSFVSVQPDNLKHMAIEDQPKKKSNGFFRIKNFQEKEVDKKKLELLKDGDEPLIYPLFDQTELAPFFADYKQAEMLKSIFEGFSDSIYQQIIKLRLEQQQQRKIKFEQEEKKKLLQLIEKIPQMTKNVIKIKEYNVQILEQKEKINQIQHYLNMPTSSDDRQKQSISGRSQQRSQFSN